AQLVYAAHSYDVTDAMVNGQWLMRGRKLPNIDEDERRCQAESSAKKVDTFLIQRESSVLSKLIAIGGAMEGESFEVQAKVRVSEPEKVVAALDNPEIEILYSRHYHEYDTYFAFADPEQGRVRYRED